jgi:SAM-dependent methyltransferase
MATAPSPTTTAAEAGTGDLDYTDLASFFDRFVADEPHWRRRNRTYHRPVTQPVRFAVPPRSRMLEIGCGAGELLGALQPSHGVGVDVSGGMVAEARRRHPRLRFEQAAGEEIDLGETFDYVVLSDLMPYVHDLLALFDRVAAHSYPRTRVVINSYSRAWRPLVRLAEALRLKPHLKKMPHIRVIDFPYRLDEERPEETSPPAGPAAGPAARSTTTRCCSSSSTRSPNCG